MPRPTRGTRRHTTQTANALGNMYGKKVLVAEKPCRQCAQSDGLPSQAKNPHHVQAKQSEPVQTRISLPHLQQGWQLGSPKEALDRLHHGLRLVCFHEALDCALGVVLERTDNLGNCLLALGNLADLLLEGAPEVPCRVWHWAVLRGRRT